MHYFVCLNTLTIKVFICNILRRCCSVNIFFCYYRLKLYHHRSDGIYFSFLPLPNRRFSDKIIYVVIFWRRIEAVITGRTRNALALRGTWVQIPPSPRIRKAGNLVKQTIGFLHFKNMLRFPQNLHDCIIMLRIVREGAVTTIFDLPAVFLEIPGISGAVLQTVHGAVAEQAVEICKSLMTGKIFTISIFKKSIRIFHL